jgi:hypothetical protein
VRYVLRPLVLTVMAACVAWPFGQVAAGFTPGAPVGLIVGACILAALEACYAYALIRARYITGGELYRFRVVEYGLYYIVLRLAQIAIAGLPADVAARLGRGDVDALLVLLLDMPTILVFLLAVLISYIVSQTLNDLDKAEEPPDRELRPDRDATSPADSLTGRFFAIGALVLFLSGLARISFSELLNLERPPVAGLVLNVLIYFVLGLVLLGRVRLAELSARWQAQGVRTPPELTGRWVRYSLAFVALAGLLAFMLPTGYTSGALGAVGEIILVILTAIWVVFASILALLFLPLAWIASLLFGSSTIEPVQEIQQQFLPPSRPAEVGAWLEALRPFVIWTLVILMVVYVVISYLRERPEIMATLRRLAPFRFLGRLWAAFRHRVSGLIAAAEKYSPLDWLRERLARPGPRRMGFFRLGGAAPREQVLYYYLSLVRRAGELGVRRRPAQTPSEYEPVLASELPDVENELAALTDAFVEARYSPRPVDPEAPSRARALWSRLRAAMRERKINDERGKGSG